MLRRRTRRAPEAVQIGHSVVTMSQVHGCRREWHRVRTPSSQVARHPRYRPAETAERLTAGIIRAGIQLSASISRPIGPVAAPASSGQRRTGSPSASPACTSAASDDSCAPGRRQRGRGGRAGGRVPARCGFPAGYRVPARRCPVAGDRLGGERAMFIPGAMP
jgi:hypothetical protein